MSAPDQGQPPIRFCVIGAVKAATTWVQAQLERNPAIYMPPPEPHFFSREFERGWDYYKEFFNEAPAEAILGEKSADYLAHPLAPIRMERALPDIRLIVQLRDPVQRAYSDYKMLYRRGLVSGNPAEYLTGLDSPEPRFLRDGLYGEHLQRWLNHFDREQLLVFLFDDVLANGEGIVGQVSEHIGVEPVFDGAFASNSQNDSRAKLLPLPIRRALAPFKEAVQPLRGKPAFEGVRSLFAREVAYPPLSDELERWLRDFYRSDIELLESQLGRDLSAWKTERASASKTLPKSGSRSTNRLSEVSSVS